MSEIKRVDGKGCNGCYISRTFESVNYCSKPFMAHANRNGVMKLSFRIIPEDIGDGRLQECPLNQ